MLRGASVLYMQLRQVSGQRKCCCALLLLQLLCSSMQRASSLSVYLHGPTEEREWPARSLMSCFQSASNNQ